MPTMPDDLHQSDYCRAESRTSGDFGADSWIKGTCFKLFNRKWKTVVKTKVNSVYFELVYLELLLLQTIFSGALKISRQKSL